MPMFNLLYMFLLIPIETIVDSTRANFVLQTATFLGVVVIVA